MWYKTINLFSIKDFFSKCDQVRSFLQTWSHLLKKSFMENFIFWCSAYGSLYQNIMSKFCSSDYYNSKLENLITFTF